MMSHEKEERGTTLPAGSIVWSNISVFGADTKPVSMKESLFGRTPVKTKPILRNVTGVAESGRLLAIMGSSGAGKTTLLNVLTFRNVANLDVQGSILLDGKRVNKWRMREESAFVQQHDMFIGTLTVREHLQFMAKLRMGSGYTKMERNARVEEVMRKMGLAGCADTMIGIPNMVKGLSCGEQKRLSFASEILTCPSILFCDEPTSGLDAFMAAHVVQSLRMLADSGMTVVITIHQPGSQVYTLFNDVCLMAAGKVVYLGAADEAIDHFEGCGYPCPPFFNVADHLIRTIAITSNREKAQCLKRVSKIRDAFLKGNDGKRLENITNMYLGKDSGDMVYESSTSSWTSVKQTYPASFWTQFEALLVRAWCNVTRNPTLYRVTIVQTLITALVTGMVYWQTDLNVSTVMTINGILFNHIRNINFMLQFPAVPAITSELPIVLRENANGVYQTSAYFLAKNIAELPQYCLMPTIYIAIVYWMSGLTPLVTSFLYAVLVCILVTNVAISVSYAVATVFADLSIAMTFLPIFVVPTMAFGGFFINYEDIPWYFQWMSSVSYFKFAYEALAVNEWESIDYIPGCSNTTLSDCPQNGQDVLDYLSFKVSHRWMNIGIMVILILSLRLISFGALYIRTVRNR